MLTVLRILYGKNVKFGDDSADKGSSLSFLCDTTIQKTVIGALPLRRIHDRAMT